jgi:predicted metal-dependent hydrolase
MTQFAYILRRSSRARRVRVAVRPEGDVEVVLPWNAPERAAQLAVEELRPWIERRVAAVRAAREPVLSRGDSLPFLDQRLRLVRDPGRVRAHRDGEELRVPGSDPWPAIERWYRGRARVEIASRLDHATAGIGAGYAGLSIRGQRTRWASCSATGRMSFNWRLLLAPERVLDYVVWHEVCHLEVMDHSARFWALLESRWPGYREDRAWLSRFGPSLTLY